jgi:SAM-dependent methyltransferase
MSEAYDPDNLLDRLSASDTLQLHYDHMRARETALLAPRLGLAGGTVLSVGCGWNPGRHLFPKPDWRMTGVELEHTKPQALVADGTLDEGFAGAAGCLGLDPESFDVVLYRLVLHHIAYQGPLAPIFAEAAEVLRPGGALIAIEPGAWHPVGIGLSLANSVGLGTAVHGTPDDIPLSPRRLISEAKAAGLRPELYAVTYTWRRMPPRVQRSLWGVDERFGARRGLARLGHTLMLVARKPVASNQ